MYFVQLLLALLATICVHVEGLDEPPAPAEIECVDEPIAPRIAWTASENVWNATFWSRERPSGDERSPAGLELCERRRWIVVVPGAVRRLELPKPARRPLASRRR